MTGNRKLAAIIAGLLVVGATAILGSYYGLDGTTIVTALAIEGTLASGGIITYKGSQ